MTVRGIDDGLQRNVERAAKSPVRELATCEEIARAPEAKHTRRRGIDVYVDPQFAERGRQDRVNACVVAGREAHFAAPKSSPSRLNQSTHVGASRNDESVEAKARKGTARYSRRKRAAATAQIRQMPPADRKEEGGER